MTTRPLTLVEIQEKCERYIKQRDGVVHKGSKYADDNYRAVHYRSDYGDHPTCHCRPEKSKMTTVEEDVDCHWCMLIMEEYKK